MSALFTVSKSGCKYPKAVYRDGLKTLVYLARTSQLKSRKLASVELAEYILSKRSLQLDRCIGPPEAPPRKAANPICFRDRIAWVGETSWRSSFLCCGANDPAF